jgi:hypothetical protein
MFANGIDLAVAVSPCTSPQSELNKFREQADTQITANPARVIEITGERLEERGFLKSEQDAIMESLMTEGDLSAFGLINAVTDAAKDLGYDRKVELERYGGRLAEYSPADWNRVMEQAKN